IGISNGRKAPHPYDIKVAIGTQYRIDHISVGFFLAIENRGAEKGLPLFCRFVISAPIGNPVPTSSVSVLKIEGTLLVFKKHRIGDTVFLLPRHREFFK